jgi:hypothetical protein
VQELGCSTGGRRNHEYLKWCSAPGGSIVCLMALPNAGSVTILALSAKMPGQVPACKVLGGQTALSPGEVVQRTSTLGDVLDAIKILGGCSRMSDLHSDIYLGFWPWHPWRKS